MTRRLRCLFLLLALASSAIQAEPLPALTHNEIIDDLKAGRFNHLEARIDALQGEFSDDPAEDRALMESIWELADLGESTEITQAFAEWVQQSPESYAALLARGTYFAGLGYDARGNKYSSDTSEHRFEQMRLYFKWARADLKKSLKLTAKPLASYYELIAMAMRSGSDEDIERYHQKAVAFAPQSMEIRVLYMSNLEPRWGGSFEAMQAYVDESRKVLGEGEKLNRLRALIPAENAHIAKDAKRYPEAHEQYSAAIALSDRSSYRCYRAGINAHMKQFDQAAEDLHAAFAIRPLTDICADQVAWIACCAPQMPDIDGYLDRMVEEFPRHAGLRVRRGWRLQESGHQDRAFPDFRIAAERGDAWAQMQTGKYIFNGWGGVTVNHEEGLAWLQLAAAQGELNAQYSLAEALAQLGRHDEAAAAKKRYLEMKEEAAATVASKTRVPQDGFPYMVMSLFQWLERNGVKLSLGILGAFLLFLLFLRRSNM